MMRNKILLTFVSLCCLVVCLAADNKGDEDDDVTLFAVATPVTNDKDVAVGDSVIVSLTIYSNLSFGTVENTDTGRVAIKNSLVIPLDKRRRLSQNMAVYEGKKYYAVVVEQFMVMPDQAGSIVFPSRNYNVKLVKRIRTRSRDPFEEIFGFETPYATRTQKILKKCTSPRLKIKVGERRPQTIDDLRARGADVM
ncbi:MAG: hypothetical protein ACI4TR_04930 [Bacteroidaceae bacterium]